MFSVLATLSIRAASIESEVAALKGLGILFIGRTEEVILSLGEIEPRVRTFQCFTPDYMLMDASTSMDNIVAGASLRRIGICSPKDVTALVRLVRHNFSTVPSDAGKLLVMTAPIRFESERYLFVLGKKLGQASVNIQRYETLIVPNTPIVGRRLL